jgi:putative membrane protein insertion efficiency factor
LRHLFSQPARIAVLLIVAYQRVVSPWLGTRCRFEPSCSRYAIEAIQTQGILRGLALAVARLLRCHPFHPGGYDPVKHQAADTKCGCTDH